MARLGIRNRLGQFRKGVSSRREKGPEEGEDIFEQKKKSLGSVTFREDKISRVEKTIGGRRSAIAVLVDGKQIGTTIIIDLDRTRSRLITRKPKELRYRVEFRPSRSAAVLSGLTVEQTSKKSFDEALDESKRLGKKNAREFGRSLE